jgi:hypothetical protein
MLKLERCIRLVQDTYGFLFFTLLKDKKQMEIHKGCIITLLNLI